MSMARTVNLSHAQYQQHQKAKTPLDPRIQLDEMEKQYASRSLLTQYQYPLNIKFFSLSLASLLVS